MDTSPIKKYEKIDKGISIESISVTELVEQILGFVRRQFQILLFTIVCAMSLSLVYLFTTPARYTSHAMLMIDSSKMRVLQQQQSMFGDIPLDTAQVETQLEVLKSENVALAVVKDQHLTEDPEFVGADSGIIGALFRVVSGLFDSGIEDSSAAQSENQMARRALSAFLKQRTVTRVGRTYVLDIGVTARSPGRAAALSNAIADAYIVDQLESKYQATRRASIWLQERIKELRTQASIADRAVLEYKERNNIVDVGGTNAVGGTGARLLGEQALSEVNAQLSIARGATAEAKAKLDRITQLMQVDLPDAAVTDSLHNEVINRLRNQYLDLSARQAIWSARYGANHLAAVNLRTQMEEIRRSIVNELGRIAESYKSDYEIAKSRQDSLEKSLIEQVSASQGINRDRLGLRELESTAQVYHTIYDNFLQRYMEAIQQQSFPITEARVISPAAPPSVKSSPQTLLVLTIGFTVGALLGFALATLREAIDRVFRTTRQVEELLKTNCLTVLPIQKLSDPTRVGGRRSQGLEAQHEKLEALQQAIIARNPLLRQVVLEPLSSFAEGFRAIKVAADISGSIKENKVIGVTSTVPQEGKSTVASNLAQLIAHAGKKVILVDGDLRNPTLTRGLGRDAKVGLLELLSGKIELHEAVLTDPDTNLVFLPSVIESRLAHTNEIVASEVFKRLIDGFRQRYDYVVVDLPPIAPVVDVRATTNIIDSYLYVVEWGRTRINLVQNQLASAPELHERLLGVVLNKANVRVLARYESYYGGYYHKKYYSRYGYSE